MKILLVQPGHYSFKTGRLFKAKHKKGLCPSFVLPYLASLFPAGSDITLVDETLQEINFDEKYDLVGITVKTPQAKRAYEIAGRFRSKKIPVVMGGYHINLCPDEAEIHCDSMILGEAEPIWDSFINDLHSGKLKSQYITQSRFDMRAMSLPRFDLINFNLYSMFYGTKVPLETSRGCVNKCSYCSTPKVYEGGVVFRPLGEVVEDIKRVVKDFKQIKEPLFVFIDDNLTTNTDRCVQLFEALIPLKIKWSGYFSYQISKQRELVKLAARSGCYSAFVGLESINSSALGAANKSFNQIDDFSSIAELFRDNDIILVLGMILGFLEDRVGIFNQTIQFLIRNAIPVVVMNPLYPFPGTAVYDRLKEEGLLHDEKFWLNNHNPYSLFKNDNLLESNFTLENLFEESLKQLMSFDSIFKRTWPMKKYFIPLLIHNLSLKALLHKKGIFAFV